MSTNVIPVQTGVPDEGSSLRSRHRLRGAFRPGRIVLYVVLIVASLVMIFPFIWMVLTSLKPESEVVRYPPQLWPHQWTLVSYGDVWSRVPFGRFFVNS
jgi:multiple sugar transport system permease protein